MNVSHKMLKYNTLTPINSRVTTFKQIKFMLGIIKKAALAIAIVAAPLFSSCGSDSGSGPEFLEAFHYSYYGSMPDVDAIQEHQLNLFVDYSTCIAQAMNYDQTGRAHV